MSVNIDRNRGFFKMNTWFTSDWHIHHDKPFIYEARGYDSNEAMRKALVEWNNDVVKEDDEIWVLGDVSFGTIDQTIDFMGKLKGKYFLVLGNHDFNIKKNIHLFKKYFITMQDYREIKIDKQKIVLCHYPMRSWNGSNYNSWMLHGHTHNSLSPYGKSVDVGLDSEFITGKRENRFFNFEEIKTFMLNRQVVKDYGD